LVETEIDLAPKTIKMSFAGHFLLLKQTEALSHDFAGGLVAP
jgi:hypothetical protein